MSVQETLRPVLAKGVKPSWALFETVFAIHVIIAFAVGEESWDDGYITLAFSRTFAESGHIGLTPYSEVVEGATSPAWFLLMAGVYRLGITGFYEFHLASQLLAALCAAVLAVLLYRLIRPSVPVAAWWISLVTLLLGPFRGETANGMEMTLLSVVVIGIMLLIRERDNQSLWGGAALSALVPWIRLEAIGYVCLAALAIAVFSRRYRVAAAIIGGSVVSLVALSVIRYFLFGTVVLTNTMIAKMHPPYSPPFGTRAWLQQFMDSVLMEPVIAVLPALAISLFLLRLSDTRARTKFGEFVRLGRSRELPARISFGAVYAIAFIGLLLAVGGNYYARPGRMGASAMIVLVAVAALAIPVARRVQPPKLWNKIAVAALFVVPWLGVLAQDTYGLYYGHIDRRNTLAQHNWTTSWRASGEAIDHVRQLLERPSIKALIVNVGAASLCCQRIEVLDLGLLANSELAHQGWSQFGEYLETEKPDIINGYGVWAEVSELYDNDYFRRNYTPVVMADAWLFLRNDYYEQIKDRCVEVPVAENYFWPTWPGSAKELSKDLRAVDRDYIMSFGMDKFCKIE